MAVSAHADEDQQGWCASLGSQWDMGLLWGDCARALTLYVTNSSYDNHHILEMLPVLQTLECLDAIGCAVDQQNFGGLQGNILSQAQHNA